MNLQRPSQADLARMSHAEKNALIAQLFDLLSSVEQRLQELEGRVAKTSRNSSKPPSSDGLRRGAAEPRRRGERPSGGQSGHPGRANGAGEGAPLTIRDSGATDRGDGISPMAGAVRVWVRS